jgi:hypothetical protein
MRSLALSLVVLCLSVACATGGNGGGGTTPAVEKPKTVSLVPPSPVNVYSEVPHEGRIYVLGSQSSAEALAAGRTPALAVTCLGLGPKGETVVFEANKEGNLEKWLRAVWESKHPAAN